MKNLFLIVSVALLFVSCTRSGDPDVTDIKVNIQLGRFDQDFFKIDTSNIANSIQDLQTKYPGFLAGYVENILGLPLDSVMVNASAASDAVKQFVKDYTPVKDSCEKLFGDFAKQTREITAGLQHVKYYFPKYNLPGKIITFIGPMDAFFSTSFGIQGDIITQQALGIALQLHLGKDFSFYNSPQGMDLYPAYISNNFDPQHIPINSMKNIIDDMFPPGRPGSLIENMVSSGRRYFLLKKFLPETNESALLGYTDEQMKGAKKNEAMIWDFFLNNDLLNVSDPNIVKNYVGPSPKTQEFGEGSPGNLGSFAGLQIVKKYMEKFPETSLDSLMHLPTREIYEQSKYKPRD